MITEIKPEDRMNWADNWKSKMDRFFTSNTTLTKDQPTLEFQRAVRRMEFDHHLGRHSRGPGRPKKLVPSNTDEPESVCFEVADSLT